MAAWAPAIDASPRAAPGASPDHSIRRLHLPQRPRAFGVRVGGPEHHQWVGTQAGEHDRRADEKQDGAEHVRPDQFVEADQAREVLLERREDRAEDCSERAHPHDRRDRLGALVGCGEIGTHVAALQGRRLTGAEHRHSDHEQREPAQLPAGAGHDRTQRTDEERGHEPRPAAVPAHVGRQRDRRDRRSHREGRARQTGEAIAAEQVTRQQRHDGDRRGDGRLTGNLRPPQRVQCPAVQHPEVVGGDHRVGHRC